MLLSTNHYEKCFMWIISLKYMLLCYFLHFRDGETIGVEDTQVINEMCRWGDESWICRPGLFG